MRTHKQFRHHQSPDESTSSRRRTWVVKFLALLSLAILFPVLLGIGQEEDPEADDDGDGLSNYEEEYQGFYVQVPTIEYVFDEELGEDVPTTVYVEELVFTNPYHEDTDGDLIEDGIELDNQLNPVDASDGLGDFDTDGLPTFLELMLYGTDPRNADSDADGRGDGIEALIFGTNPMVHQSIDPAANPGGEGEDSQPPGDSGTEESPEVGETTHSALDESLYVSTEGDDDYDRQSTLDEINRGSDQYSCPECHSGRCGF